MTKFNLIISLSVSLIIVLIVYLGFWQFGWFWFVNANNVISVIGLLITAIAFGFGLYFFVLAVSAYSHFKQIDSIRKDVIQYRDNILEDRDKNHAMGLTFINLLDSFMGDWIDFQTFAGSQYVMHTEDRTLINDRIKLAFKMRASLGVFYDYLEKDKRKIKIEEYCSLADDYDWQKIAHMLRSQPKLDHEFIVLINELAAKHGKKQLIDNIINN